MAHRCGASRSATPAQRRTPTGNTDEHQNNKRPAHRMGRAQQGIGMISPMMSSASSVASVRPMSTSARRSDVVTNRTASATTPARALDVTGRGTGRRSSRAGSRAVHGQRSHLGVPQGIPELGRRRARACGQSQGPEPRVLLHPITHISDVAPDPESPPEQEPA